MPFVNVLTMYTVTDDPIQVEVVYARERVQVLLTVKGPHGLSAADAVERSGILDRFPEIDLAVNKLGVFGKVVRPVQVLQSGDRVEIYAPLIADPRQARRDRAAATKKSDVADG